MTNRQSTDDIGGLTNTGRALDDKAPDRDLTVADDRRARASARRTGAWLGGVGGGAGIVALVVLPLIVTSAVNRSLATTAVIYAIVALGLGMTYGRLGLLAMSQPGIWGVGAYTAAVLMQSCDLTFAEATLGAVAAGLIAGCVSALPAFRLSGHYLLIAGFILTALLVDVEGNLSITDGQNGLVLTNSLGSLAGIKLSSQTSFYYVALFVLFVGMVVDMAVTRSRLGRKFGAVRESRLLAASLGISARASIVTCYTIAGAFAGAGGALFVASLQFVVPDEFGINAAVMLPLIVMIGGVRRTWGPVLGAFVVVFLPQFIHLQPYQATAANGVLLIVIILLLPEGLLGGLSRLIARTRATWTTTRAGVNG
jgi:branched-chain amino acid transport system permease protein